MVAVVVKYADNILKTFASAVSILTSTLLSMAIFQFHPGFSFVIGAILVMLSIVMYGKRTTANANSSSFRLSKRFSSAFQTVVDDNSGGSSSHVIDTKIPV